jgi:hypothetical protein
MELVEDGDGRLSVVLAGHPKLRNDLRRPTMEEIGYRTDIFSLDGIAGSQREYIHWLLETCTAGKVEAESILSEEAIDLLATKLRTPLQIQLHLSMALGSRLPRLARNPSRRSWWNQCCRVRLDDLEPTLTRHGYRIKDLVDQFDARPAMRSKRCLATRWIRRAPLSCATRCCMPGLPI